MSDHRPCGCEPDLGPGTYARECDYCGRASASAHCVHDVRQDPCPECDVLPVGQLYGARSCGHVVRVPTGRA